ncbi:MAG: ATP-binding protein [Pseudomonadota bacterium]
MTALDPDRLSTGLIQVNQGGQIIWANQAAYDLLGSKPEHLKSDSLGALSRPLERLHERARDSRGTLSVTEVHIVEDGPVLDLFVQNLDDHCLFEIHAVTERVRLRERTERADREQAVTLLARSLAHELRNPLAGVRGAAQLIASSLDADAIHRHAQMIQREVDRITALVDKVAEERPATLKPINLHQVLDDALELVQAESGGRLEVVRFFDPSIPEQLLDEVRLHQLFLNLLRNSVQAGAMSLKLSSRIELDSPVINPPAQHAIRFDIEDDGEGVPEALRDRLFLPLVTGRDQGSGFGLAVVQQIARAHDGLVNYHNLPQGSRFTLRLPLKASTSTEIKRSRRG